MAQLGSIRCLAIPPISNLDLFKKVSTKGDPKVIPTIKTLTRHNIPEPKTVRDLMSGAIDPETFASARQWADQCHHRPGRVELALHAIDEVIGGYGVEGIPDEDYRKPGISYVNLFNIYTTTIVHDGSRWLVADFATVYEMKHGETI